MVKGYTIAELIESDKKRYEEKIEKFCKTSERRKIKTDRLQISDLIPSYNVVYTKKEVEVPKPEVKEGYLTEETDTYYVKYGLTFMK